MDKILEIIKPDDFHLHLRDGAELEASVKLSALYFKRALIMPNLKVPVTTVEMALEYKERILSNVPSKLIDFKPLMTLYLTNNTTIDDVIKAKNNDIIAFKLYPANVTTHSHHGVTNIEKMYPVFNAMAENGIILCIHGEISGVNIDIFDKEKIFIKKILEPLISSIPNLKIVLEHISTKDAVEFVMQCSSNVAATITPQHITLNRNDLFKNGGLRPHNYCLPILKREEHRVAVLKAATSGNRKFFLGTDSAPHSIHKKENACGCAGIFNSPVALSLYAQAFENENALDKLELFCSINGAHFYGLDQNNEKIKIIKEKWRVPEKYEFGNSHVIPLMANETLQWKVIINSI